MKTRLEIKNYHWHVAQISVNWKKLKFNYESSFFFTAHSSFQIIAVYFTSNFVVALTKLIIWSSYALAVYYLSTGWCLEISPVVNWTCFVFTPAFFWHELRHFHRQLMRRSKLQDRTTSRGINIIIPSWQFFYF